MNLLNIWVRMLKYLLIWSSIPAIRSIGTLPVLHHFQCRTCGRALSALIGTALSGRYHEAHWLVFILLLTKGAIKVPAWRSVRDYPKDGIWCMVRGWRRRADREA